MDALKRQADADAIRHAAKMIKAVRIEAVTVAGDTFASWLHGHLHDLAKHMNWQADMLEERKQ